MKFLENQRRLNKLVEKAETFDSTETLFSQERLRKFLNEQRQPANGYRFSQLVPFWRNTGTYWLDELHLSGIDTTELSCLKEICGGGRQGLSYNLQNLQQIGFTPHNGLLLRFPKHEYFFIEDMQIVDPKKQTRLRNTYELGFC